MKRVLSGLLMGVGLANAASVADLYTPSEVTAIKDKMMSKTKGPFASETLKQYGNHYTMVAYREETGSSEIHQKEADIFVVEKGSAIIVIGGKMVGGKETKPGELRGTSITGGEKLALKTGDVLHIPAGTPHQILVTKGTPITYFVVKVTGQ